MQNKNMMVMFSFLLYNATFEENSVVSGFTLVRGTCGFTSDKVTLTLQETLQATTWNVSYWTKSRIESKGSQICYLKNGNSGFYGNSVVSSVFQRSELPRKAKYVEQMLQDTRLTGDLS